MSMAEKSIVRQMHFEQGMSRTDIASALGRSLSSVSRLLAQKKAPRPIGRPHVLTEAKVDRMCTMLEHMVDEADGKYEVTIHMVLRLIRGRRQGGLRHLSFCFGWAQSVHACPEGVRTVCLRGFQISPHFNRFMFAYLGVLRVLW